ncbi:hypothetical protein [Massilia aerilata]|uniref:Uncharacterized protein n=1 Tax=Massilia aerilata TaxID=453817 RepID=A0ABW0RTN9_9BURK
MASSAFVSTRIFTPLAASPAKAFTPSSVGTKPEEAAGLALLNG